MCNKGGLPVMIGCVSHATASFDFQRDEEEIVDAEAEVGTWRWLATSSGYIS